MWLLVVANVIVGVLMVGWVLKSRGVVAGGERGLRLRSGAFAPDCPVVILVTAFGGSFGFPRARSTRPAFASRHDAALALGSSFTGGLE